MSCPPARRIPWLAADLLVPDVSQTPATELKSLVSLVVATASASIGISPTLDWPTKMAEDC